MEKYYSIAIGIRDSGKISLVFETTYGTIVVLTKRYQ